MTRGIPAALVLLVAAAASRAQDGGTQSGAKPPQMSAAQQAAMEKYMKAATPGPEHQRLAKLAGKWNLHVTAWMAPGAPPEKSDATAEFKSVLGGRYLRQEVKGTMGGQPFEGMGIEGYDNVTGERFGSWVDSMSTGQMVVRGACAAGAKKCALKGRVSDALIGREVPITETMTMTDENHFSFEMHGPGPDGKTFKMLEIAYTRQ